jgi:hypothetical protein
MSYIMVVLAYMYINYITLDVKTIGADENYGDRALTNLNAAGMVMNTLARFSGGPILSKVRFKYYMIAVLVAAILLSSTIMLVASNFWVFCVFFMISLFLRGSLAVAQPVFFSQIFGPEIAAQAFSFFFTAQAFSPLILTGIINAAEPSIGIQGMFYMCSGTSAVALILAIFLYDKEMDFS